MATPSSAGQPIAAAKRTTTAATTATATNSSAVNAAAAAARIVEEKEFITYCSKLLNQFENKKLLTVKFCEEHTAILDRCLQFNYPPGIINWYCSDGLLSAVLVLLRRDYMRTEETQEVALRIRMFFIHVIDAISDMLRRDQHTSIATAGVRPGFLLTLTHIVDGQSYRFYNHFDGLLHHQGDRSPPRRETRNINNRSTRSNNRNRKRFDDDFDEEGDYSEEGDMDDMDDDGHGNNNGNDGGSTGNPQLDALRKINRTRWPAESHMAAIIHAFFRTRPTSLLVEMQGNHPPSHDDIWQIFGSNISRPSINTSVTTATTPSNSDATTPSGNAPQSSSSDNSKSNETKMEAKTPTSASATATTATIVPIIYNDGRGHDGRPTHQIMRLLTQFAMKLGDNLRGTVGWSIMVRYWMHIWRPWLTSMTDTEIKDSPKNYINEQTDMLYMAFTNTLVGPASEKQLDEAYHHGIEVVDLLMSFKLLTFTVLERRIAGLQQIRRFVTEWVHGSDNMSSNNMHTPWRQEARQPGSGFFVRLSSKKLTNSWLCKYLHDNHFIEHLFGDGFHVQLVKRSHDILKWMAENDGLTDGHLEAIWDAGRGKHETVAKEIYDIVALLAPVLTQMKASYLWSLVERVPFNQLDVPLLYLYRNFTLSAVKNYEPLILYSSANKILARANSLPTNAIAPMTTTEGVVTTTATTTTTNNTTTTTTTDGVRTMDASEDEVIYGTGTAPSNITVTVTSAADSSSAVHSGADSKQREVKVPSLPSHHNTNNTNNNNQHGHGHGGNVNNGHDDNDMRLAYEHAEATVIQGRPWFGFDNLWKVINGRECAMSSELIHVAYHHLMELCNLEWFACRRRQLIRQCCRNIDQRWNVVWSIKVLQHMINCGRGVPPQLVNPSHHHRATEHETNPQWYCQCDDRTCVIEWTESEFHLQQRILADLVSTYTPMTAPSSSSLSSSSSMMPLVSPRSVASAPSSSSSPSMASSSSRSMSPMPGAAAINNNTVNGNQIDPSTLLDSREALHDRLHLLSYLAQWCASVRLTYDNIRTVWNLFITQPAREGRERDAIYHWLTDALARPNGAIPDGDALRVFNELVPNLDFTTLSLAGWEFFQAYFRAINQRNNRFAYGVAEGRPFYTMIRADMIGWELLWNIAFLAKEHMVSDRALSIMNGLLRSFADHLPDDTNRMYHKCIDDCMQRLHDCSVIIERAATSATTAIDDHNNDAHQRGTGTGTGEKRKRDLLAPPVPNSSSSSSSTSFVHDSTSSSSSLSSMNEVDSAERQIDRAFTLLNSFFESFKGKQLPSHASFINGNGSNGGTSNGAGTSGTSITPVPNVPLTIEFKTVPVVEGKHITFPSSGSITQLKAEAAKWTKWPLHLVRMIAGGKELHPSDDPLIRVMTLTSLAAPIMIHLVRRTEESLANSNGNGNSGSSGASTPAAPTSGTNVNGDRKEKETKSQAGGADEGTPIPANAAAAAALPPPLLVGATNGVVSPPLIEHPSLILSSPAYFTQLFGLLSLKRNGRDKWAERAWSLLMRLPTDGRILQQLRGVATTTTTTTGATNRQWDELLASNNIHRLHYSLQIVNSLLNAPSIIPIPSSPVVKPAASVGESKHKENKTTSNNNNNGNGNVDDMVTTSDEGSAVSLRSSHTSSAAPAVAPAASDAPFDAAEWKRNFVRFGALEHLATILANNDFTPSSSSSNTNNNNNNSNSSNATSSHSTQELECLSLVLKVLLKFVGVSSPPSTVTSAVTPDSSSSSSSSSSNVASGSKRRRDDEVTVIPPSLLSSLTSKGKKAEHAKDGNDRRVKARTAPSSSSSSSSSSITSVVSSKRGDDESTDEEADDSTTAVNHGSGTGSGECHDDRLTCLYQPSLLLQLFHFLQTVSQYPSITIDIGDDMVKMDKSSSIGDKANGKSGSDGTSQRADVVVDVVTDLVEVLRCILCRPRHWSLCEGFVLAPNVLASWTQIILSATRSSIRKNSADALCGVARYWYNAPNGDLSMHRRILSHMISLLANITPFTTMYRESSAHFFRTASTLFSDLSQPLALLDVYESQQWSTMTARDRTRYGTNISDWATIRLLPLLHLVCTTLRSYPIDVVTSNPGVVTDQSLQGLMNITRAIVKANTHILTLQAPSTTAKVAETLTFPYRYAMARTSSNNGGNNDNKAKGGDVYGPQLPGASNTNNNSNTNSNDNQVDASSATTGASPITDGFKPPAGETPASSIISKCGLIDHVFHRLLFDIRSVVSPADLYPAATSATASLSLSSSMVITSPAALPPSSIEPPLCKTTPSRTAAFDLLLDLANTSQANHQRLVSLVNPLHERDDDPLTVADWYYYPQAIRKVSPYVGLLNLGATCYMNSLMQQLFMVPEFRYGVLSQKEDKLKNDNDKQENLFYQLQRIFGYLQDSEKKYYDARGFCHAYKDWEGQSMNHGLQMDVNEFFNVLFDKLEAELKKSPHEKLLDHAFGGKIANQLICRVCPNRSEREENFYILSLEVKNKRSILESLQLYVEGEMLEGDNKYMCSKCGKKVDTLKRSCVKELPRNLILHLKRFEFDLDTMRKIKINDHCEFPAVIDLRPYTKEGLEHAAAAAAATASAAGGAPTGPTPSMDPPQDEKLEKEPGSGASSNSSANDGTPSSSLPPLRDPAYYKYQLVGVLVHTGTCNSGHYYSYIKDRTSDSGYFGAARAPVNPSTTTSADTATRIPATPSNKSAAAATASTSSSSSTSSPSPSVSSLGGKWYHFNDTSVEPWNPAELAAQCFGGQENVYRWDDLQQKQVQQWCPKPYNAYMLFYQRIENLAMHEEKESKGEEKALPTPILTPTETKDTKVDDDSTAKRRRMEETSVIVKASASETNSIMEYGIHTSGVSHDALMAFRERLVTAPPYHVPRWLSPWEASALLPSSIFTSVHTENMRFARDKHIYDSAYFQFIWRVIQVGQHYAPICDTYEEQSLTPMNSGYVQLQNIQLAVSFILNTLIHAKVKNEISSWDTDLQLMFEHHIPACRWFLLQLINHASWLTNGMFACNNAGFRRRFTQVILHVVRELRDHERPWYEETIAIPIERKQLPVAPAPTGDCVPCAPLSSSSSSSSSAPISLGDAPPLSSPNEAVSSLSRADTIPFDASVIPSSSSPSAPVETINTEVVSRSSVLRFIEHLVNQLPNDVHTNYKNCEQYWQLLADIAEKRAERVHIREHLLLYLQFFLGSDSPVKPTKLAVKKPRKKHHDQLGGYFKLLALLLQPSSSGKLAKLSADEDKILRGDATFMDALIDDFADSRAQGAILVACVTNNKELNDRAIIAINKGINAAVSSHIPDWIKFTHRFLGIHDEFKVLRWQRIMMGIADIIVKSHIKYEDECTMLLKWLMKLLIVNQNTSLRERVFLSTQVITKWTPLLFVDSVPLRDLADRLFVILAKDTKPKKTSKTKKGRGNGTKSETKRPSSDKADMDEKEDKSSGSDDDNDDDEEEKIIPTNDDDDEDAEVDLENVDEIDSESDDDTYSDAQEAALPPISTLLPSPSPSPPPTGEGATATGETSVVASSSTNEVKIREPGSVKLLRYLVGEYILRRVDFLADGPAQYDKQGVAIASQFRATGYYHVIKRLVKKSHYHRMVALTHLELIMNNFGYPKGKEINVDLNVGAALVFFDTLTDGCTETMNAFVNHPKNGYNWAIEIVSVTLSRQPLTQPSCESFLSTYMTLIRRFSSISIDFCNAAMEHNTTKWLRNNMCLTSQGVPWSKVAKGWLLQMKFAAERLPEWRMKQYGEVVSVTRIEGCKDAFIGNPLTTLDWLHYLVSGRWDKKVQSSTDEYVREAFIAGLQAFTASASSSSSSSASSEASLADGSGGGGITSVTDSPLTQEHDAFIKARGLTLLSTIANTLYRRDGQSALSEWNFLHHCRLISIMSHIFANYIGGRRPAATLESIWSHDERMSMVHYLSLVLRHPIMRGHDDPRVRPPANPSAEERKTKNAQVLATELSRATDAYRAHVDKCHMERDQVWQPICTLLLFIITEFPSSRCALLYDALMKDMTRESLANQKDLTSMNTSGSQWQRDYCGMVQKGLTHIPDIQTHYNVIRMALVQAVKHGSEPLKVDASLLCWNTGILAIYEISACSQWRMSTRGVTNSADEPPAPLTSCSVIEPPVIDMAHHLLLQFCDLLSQLRHQQSESFVTTSATHQLVLMMIRYRPWMLRYPFMYQLCHDHMHAVMDMSREGHALYNAIVERMQRCGSIDWIKDTTRASQLLDSMRVPYLMDFFNLAPPSSSSPIENRPQSLVSYISSIFHMVDLLFINLDPNRNPPQYIPPRMDGKDGTATAAAAATATAAAAHDSKAVMTQITATINERHIRWTNVMMYLRTTLKSSGSHEIDDESLRSIAVMVDGLYDILIKRYPPTLPPITLTSLSSPSAPPFAVAPAAVAVVVDANSNGHGVPMAVVAPPAVSSPSLSSLSSLSSPSSIVKLVTPSAAVATTVPSVPPS